MKKHIYLLLAFAIMMNYSCRTEHNKLVSVIRDCTGTYLRCNENDYQVCNTESLIQYEDGEMIMATFKKIKACTGSAADAIHCAMYHEYEGWIEVKK